MIFNNSTEKKQFNKKLEKFAVKHYKRITKKKTVDDNVRKNIMDYATRYLSHVYNKTSFNHHYDQYFLLIEDIAVKHYKGIHINHTMDKNIREKIKNYIDNNKNVIEKCLISIGYIDEFTLKEILQIIYCKPYIEIIFNETNIMIIVCYYEHLLDNIYYYLKLSIKGKRYEGMFNIMTNEFEFNEDKNIKLELITMSLTKSGYSKLYYKLIET